MAADRLVRPPGHLALLCGLVCAVAGQAICADAGPAELIHGRWQVRSPLGEVQGLLLAAVSSGGCWRLEAGLDGTGPAGERSDPGRRRGEGWTFCADRDGAFRQVWHHPWRRLDGTTAAALADALEILVLGPCAAERRERSGMRRWRPEAATGGQALVLPSGAGILEDASGRADAARSTSVDRGALRRRLVARGRGRGGDDLLVRLRWREGSLELSTARWPGHLSVAVEQRARALLPPEAYLPLWPLAEFLP